MVQPPEPWPMPPEKGELLDKIVVRGDCEEARAHLDDAFWQGRPETPEWRHLKKALIRENRPMVRLLLTWGAKAGEEHFAELKKEAPHKYATYMALLRQGGFYVPPKALADLPAPATRSGDETAEALPAPAITYPPLKPMPVEAIPAEWRRLLKGFQDLGAPEAVIAGGALRDLFNDRAIKDVDIFLLSRGSTRKNAKFLRKAFAEAEVDFPKTPVWTSEYGREHGGKDRPLGEPERCRAEGQDVHRYAFLRETEAWTVRTDARKKGDGLGTEYNIIFIDDETDRVLAKSVKGTRRNTFFWNRLLRHFDVGACQIGFDGDEIVATPEYRDDVRHKRIVLHKPEFSTQEHLQRLADKFPDWTLCPEAEKMRRGAQKPQKPGTRIGHKRMA